MSDRVHTDPRCPNFRCRSEVVVVPVPAPLSTSTCAGCCYSGCRSWCSRSRVSWCFQAFCYVLSLSFYGVPSGLWCALRLIDVRVSVLSHLGYELIYFLLSAFVCYISGEVSFFDKFILLHGFLLCRTTSSWAFLFCESLT